MVVVDLGNLDAGDGEALTIALEQITPLAEALRPGLHTFGARGPSRYFGGEQALVELVAQAAADAAPPTAKVSVGVADGLFAAGLAARVARRSRRPSPAGTAVVVSTAAEPAVSSRSSAEGSCRPGLAPELL